MADAVPNYFVEQQRLKTQISAQRHNIERQRLDIMEMADRARRHLENIAASEKAIGEMEVSLQQLQEAHGEAGEQAFQEAVQLVVSGG